MTRNKDIELASTDALTGAQLTKAEAKLQELEGRADLEKLKLYGKVLDAISTVVKTLAQTKALEARGKNLHRQIEIIREQGKIAEQGAKGAQAIQADKYAHMKAVVQEYIPSLIDFVGVDPARRAEVIKTALDTLTK